MSVPKLLVRYSESFGRMGHLEDTFVTTEPELKALKAIGECYRGEMLGKHSEVVSTFDDDTLKVLCDDQDWIARGVEYGVLEGPGFLARLVDVLLWDGSTRRWDLLRTLSAADFAFVCDAWGLEHD